MEIAWKGKRKQSLCCTLVAKEVSFIAHWFGPLLDTKSNDRPYTLFRIPSLRSSLSRKPSYSLIQSIYSWLFLTRAEPNNALNLRRWNRIRVYKRKFTSFENGPDGMRPLEWQILRLIPTIDLASKIGVSLAICWVQYRVRREFVTPK